MTSCISPEKLSSALEHAGWQEADLATALDVPSTELTKLVRGLLPQDESVRLRSEAEVALGLPRGALAPAAPARTRSVLARRLSEAARGLRDAARACEADADCGSARDSIDAALGGISRAQRSVSAAPVRARGGLAARRRAVAPAPVAVEEGDVQAANEDDDEDVAGFDEGGEGLGANSDRDRNDDRAASARDDGDDDSDEGDSADRDSGDGDGEADDDSDEGDGDGGGGDDDSDEGDAR